MVLFSEPSLGTPGPDAALQRPELCFGVTLGVACLQLRKDGRNGTVWRRCKHAVDLLPLSGKGVRAGAIGARSARLLRAAVPPPGAALGELSYSVWLQRLITRRATPDHVEALSRSRVDGLEHHGVPPERALQERQLV